MSPTAVGEWPSEPNDTRAPPTCARRTKRSCGRYRFEISKAIPARARAATARVSRASVHNSSSGMVRSGTGSSVGWARMSTGISEAKRSRVVTCTSMYPSGVNPAGRSPWNMSSSEPSGRMTACTEPMRWVNRRTTSGGSSRHRWSCQQHSPAIPRSGSANDSNSSRYARTRSTDVSPCEASRVT